MTLSLDLSTRPFKTQSSILLSIYFFMALSLLLVGLDLLLLNGIIRDHLPHSPTSLLLWTAIFGLPHIVSSLVTLADKEYIDHYKPKLVKSLWVICGILFLVNFVAPVVTPQSVSSNLFTGLMVVFLVYTMYHVLSQQFGICMALMKVRPGVLFETWRWLSTISASAMYFMVIFGSRLKHMGPESFNGHDITFAVAAVFCVLSTLVGFRILSQSTTKIGTWYAWGNILLVPGSLFFLATDYKFFVIAVPRLVHDLTAFYIYSTHDQNRNIGKTKNVIYRALSFLRIPPIVLCPILAIVLANFVSCGSYLIDASLGIGTGGTLGCSLREFYRPDVFHLGLPNSMGISMQIMLITGFFHYYLEGFVWKRDAIHRHSVQFN